MSTVENEAPWQRAVSGTEKFMIALNEQRPPFVIQLLVEGVGEPEPQDLFDALERTTAANPGSALRLDETDKDNSLWIADAPPSLTLFEAPGFEAQNEIDAPFLRWPMDCSNGPTCEVVFIKGKTHNYLLFRVAHAVMDGQGTLRWVRDFFKCLRGEEPIGHASTLDGEALMASIKTERRKFPEPNAIHACRYEPVDEPNRFYWRRIHADRPLDSTATGRICVGVADFARRDGREGIVRVSLPTDLRHYCPDEASTANLYTSLFVEVPDNAVADLIGLQVVRKLYKHETKKPFGLYSADDSGPLTVHRVKVWHQLETATYGGTFSISATLSHLGGMKSEELSAPSFEAKSALFVPLTGDLGCVLNVNGFDDHLEVSVGISNRFASNGQMEGLADAIRKRIDA